MLTPAPPLEESSLINLDDDEIELLKSLLGSFGIEKGFKTSDLKNLGSGMSDSRIYKFW